MTDLMWHKMSSFPSSGIVCPTRNARSGGRNFYREALRETEREADVCNRPNQQNLEQSDLQITFQTTSTRPRPRIGQRGSRFLLFYEFTGGIRNDFSTGSSSSVPVSSPGHSGCFQRDIDIRSNCAAVAVTAAFRLCFRIGTQPVTGATATGTATLSCSTLRHRTASKTSFPLAGLVDFKTSWESFPPTATDRALEGDGGKTLQSLEQPFSCVKRQAESTLYCERSIIKFSLATSI